MRTVADIALRLERTRTGIERASAIRVPRVTRYWRYNKEKMQQLYDEGKIEFRPSGKVPRLKVYLDDAPGVAIGDVWTDIRGMINLSHEMLGYPTQKPEALLGTC